MNPIGWCQQTWVPYTGCDKISPGCEGCYAIRMSWRLAHNPKTKHFYEGTVKKTAGGKLNWTGEIKENIPQLDKPLRTKKPTIFFVNSMSDVFHEALTNEQIDDIFQIMSMCPQHIFQVLTKRHEHMLKYFQWKMFGHGHKYKEWPLKNVWLGVSVENQKYADMRIPMLLQVPASVRFLSCEPLLGSINFNFTDFPAGMKWRSKNYLTGILRDENGFIERGAGIDWVICGGESGPDARPIHPYWVEMIKTACEEAKVPFYFKQWGEFAPGSTAASNKSYAVLLDGRYAPYSELTMQSKPLGLTVGEWNNLLPNTMTRVGKHNAGRLLDGKEYSEFPEQIKQLNK